MQKYWYKMFKIMQNYAKQCKWLENYEEYVKLGPWTLEMGHFHAAFGIGKAES